jgi:hypothetical protein
MVAILELVTGRLLLFARDPLDPEGKASSELFQETLFFLLFRLTFQHIHRCPITFSLAPRLEWSSLDGFIDGQASSMIETRQNWGDAH